MSVLTKLTVPQRSTIAHEMFLSLPDSDNDNDVPNNWIYVTIGKAYPWSGNDTILQNPVETVNALNQVYRDMVAAKLIIKADAAMVVRRVDWTSNTIYDQFDNNTEMYSHTKAVVANGTINVSNGSTTITGTNTTFLLDFSNNDILQIPGDDISIFPSNYEIISISNNTQMTVNIGVSGNIVSNTPYNYRNYYPNMAYNFYVRNSYDQVFVCLYNNNGSYSTAMPQISLGGDLPTSAYIITADGYYWKYMYTIPGGYKQTFLTPDWMPVLEEAQVQLAAIPGGISLIEIVNTGSGYNNNVASFSLPILNVSGDGTGANLTAQVDSNGSIVGVNVLNPGSGYTYATINVTGLTSGVPAQINAVIQPQGGWGSNAQLQLGSTTIMFSTQLTDTENGTIPTVDSLGDYFKYRQIALLANPVIANTTNTAQSTNYLMTSIISVSANNPISMNDIVYQSPTGLYANSTYSANVVYFDDSTNQIRINNEYGSFNSQDPIYATKDVNSSPYTTMTPFAYTAPPLTRFSGSILYYENRLPVERSPGQTESIRLIASF